jgi:hypothetical protein
MTGAVHCTVYSTPLLVVQFRKVLEVLVVNMGEVLSKFLLSSPRLRHQHLSPEQCCQLLARFCGRTSRIFDILCLFNPFETIFADI